MDDLTPSTFGPDAGRVEEPDAGLAAGAGARLRALADSVVDRRPIARRGLSFDLSWLSDPRGVAAIANEMKQLVAPNERAIYQFSLRDPHAYDALRDAYALRPLHKGEDRRPLKYSRMMAPQSPNALYVGSGQDLRTRVGQHVGRIGGPGTYAMRLALWATGVEATVDLAIWLYERGLDPIELEALEQTLWDARTPLLGKRSGK